MFFDMGFTECWSIEVHCFGDYLGLETLTHLTRIQHSWVGFQLC